MDDAATSATHRQRFALRTVRSLSLCCWLVLPGSPAWAEILYDREGIQLRGTARIVSHNAATCNVLEEKYSPEEYERLKVNQGQPLHVWQLDISAHNNTGKPLDFLSAHFNIESPWPPCTNWSGEGPGGGPAGDFTDGEGRPKPLEWADTLKVLSMPYGMRLGQVERDTVFLVVFHEDRPLFKNWSVDFRFGRSGSEAQQATGAPASRDRPAGTASRQRIDLPPKILADRYLRQAEQLLRDDDSSGAREALEKLLALQQEHGLEPDPEDNYRFARIWSAAGEPERALESAVRYLQLRGRDAEHYDDALDLINRAEARQSRARTGETGPQTATKINPSLTCEGKPAGADCWRALADPSDCYLWEAQHVADILVTWTGECSGGLAQGDGTLTWEREDDSASVVETGRLQEGKRHGDWVERFKNRRIVTIEEGPYVEGKRHGQWVVRFKYADFEAVKKGRFVDGKRHGDWVERFRSGGYRSVDEGPYVDGKRHGQWVVRQADGTVEEGPYVQGKKHGAWVERDSDGELAEGPYVDGKRHGQWVFRNSDGDFAQGSYVEGKRHGQWVFRFADGTGEFVETYQNGETVQGPRQR